MMASMVDKKGSSCASQLSRLSVQEKASRSKRKFHADPPVNDSGKVLPSVLNDGSSYESSAEKEIAAIHEKLGHSCDACGVYQDPLESLKNHPGSSLDGISDEDPSEEGEVDDLYDAHWSDLTEGQLEALVLSNLDTIFKGAIKKIVAHGYTEEAATNAVLKSGFCYAPKDSVPNIVDYALAFLRDGKDVDPSGEHCFEDLQQLAKHVFVKLVCAIREVWPSFSTGDAMWCLLICDMNVTHAFAMDGDPLSSLFTDGSSNGRPGSTIQDQSEPKSTEMSLPDLRKTTPTGNCGRKSHSDVKPIPAERKVTKPNKSLPSSGRTSEKGGSAPLSPNTFEKPMCATPGVEEKTVSSRKVHSNNSKILRQKFLHLDKSYRAGGTKGAFRAAKFSGFLLDKRYKSLPDSAGLSLKSASVKISKAVAMGVQLAQEHGALNKSSSSSFSSSAMFDLDPQCTVSTLPKTDRAPAAPLVKPISSMPVADTELSLSLPSKSNNNTPQGNMSGKVKVPNTSVAGLPDARSFAQWIPQDEKDEKIIKLIPRIRELQNQLQEWTEWANQKVMQAARRLSKDKAELKTLRLEKEEVERLRKEKQSFEDNTMKKLSEMENALGKASGQVGLANAAVKRLEVENASLRREMEVAKLQAAESAASCLEVSMREKKMLTDSQSWDKQKTTFLEELAAERRQLAHLAQELEQAKHLHNQLEVRWKQEEKAKKDLQAKANSIRKEREQLEASVKEKEEAVRLRAKEDSQKYEDNIHNLEKEIAQMRLKTDSSKIAALKRGIDVGMLIDSQATPNSKESQDQFTVNECHFSSTGGVKRERECVMCLSEEMSVVFLPCAHQVVCKMCNELHERQGMIDCPSCRSPIVRRICVRYARP